MATQLSLTICVLTYGNYPELLRRCVGSILATGIQQEATLRIGLNGASEDSRHWAQSIANAVADVRVFDSAVNIFKYPLMRRMFHEAPIATEWVLWFDDDTHVEADVWRPALDRVLSRDSCDYFGKPYFMCLGSGQQRWIQQAPWYRGIPFRVHKGLTPKADFMTGGFWGIRTSALYAIDWPDTRLRNNGGDVMLGEAANQFGLRRQRFHTGVKISDHARRGASHSHPTA